MAEEESESRQLQVTLGAFSLVGMQPRQVVTMLCLRQGHEGGRVVVERGRMVLGTRRGKLGGARTKITLDMKAVSIGDAKWRGATLYMMIAVISC